MLQNFATNHAVKVALRQLLPNRIVFNVADDDAFIVLGSDAGKFGRNFHAPNFTGLMLLQSSPSTAHAAADVQNSLGSFGHKFKHEKVTNGLVGILTLILNRFGIVKFRLDTRPEAARHRSFTS